MLVRADRPLGGNAVRKRELSGSSKQQSIDQKLQEKAVVFRLRSLPGILAADPGVNNGRTARRSLKLNTVDSVPRPTPMKVQPRLLEKDEPLVLHLFGNQTALDEFKFFVRVRLSKAQLSASLREGTNLPGLSGRDPLGFWTLH